MRILYVDANGQYVNPTASLLPLLMLAVSADTRFYGPGYSSRQELEAGLRRWVDANGPFDAVVLGPLTPFFTDDGAARAAGVEFVMRYTVHPPFSAADLGRFFDDVLGALGALPVPLRIVTSLALDTYASTQAQVDRMLEAGVLLLGPNHQFVRPLAEWRQDVFGRERHYQAKLSRLSDAWLGFLTDYPERVLTATHYVGEHEFCLTALEDRPWDIAIPGVEYALRRDAIASLKSSRARVAPKGHFYAFRIASRLGFPVHRHHLTARLYNMLFQRTLFTSRMVFTASGGSGGILRKFVEIPAAGAAMVCVPCNGFEAIGFEDGRNYVEAEPRQLADVVRALRQDPRLERIAAAGRDLMTRRHSMRARADQVAACLAAARAGSYRGATWENGEFVVAGTAVAA